MVILLGLCKSDLEQGEEIMHVLFLAAYYPPEKTADTHLEQDLIEGMAKRGWKVDVVCPTPTRGCSKEDIEKYKKNKKEAQFDGKVIVHRFWAPQERTNAITRALRYLWCCIKQISIGKKIKNIDVIYCNSTPPIQGLAAHAIKKRTGSTFVYSLQDLFPDSLVTAGIAKKESFSYKIGLKIERKTYNASNSIITLSESFKKIISEKGVKPKKINVVYNWINTEGVYPIKREDNKLFDELGIRKDRFTILYAGNFGKSQNIDYLIDAAKLIFNNDIYQFVLFGAGSEFNRIKERVDSEKISNCYIFPLMPLDKVGEVYSMGDIDIVCNAPGISIVGMPSKTWTIMATGTPVVAVADADCELADIIRKSNSGWICSPSDVSDFLKLLNYIFDQPNELVQRGNSARNLVENRFSKHQAINNYLDILSLSILKD